MAEYTSHGGDTAESMLEEAGFIAGWNEATNTSITEGTYSIFKNTKGYVYLRKINLAYGNTATVIEYTDNMQDAELFRKDITELNPEDYYHKFRNVLELEIQHLKHYRINIKTTKQYTFI